MTGEPERQQRQPLTPDNDKVISAAERLRRLHEERREVYLAEDLTPIERSQVIQIDVIEMGRSGAAPDPDGRVVLYRGKDGQPVTVIPAATRLLQDRAEAVAAAVAEEGLTQRQIAERIGVSQPAVAAMLRNARNRDEAARVAAAGSDIPEDRP